MDRRDLLRGGVLTGFALLVERAFGQPASGKIIPWADQPPPIPAPAQNAIHNLTPWEALDSWITPNDKFFSIAHYNRPTIDAATWRLSLSGLVANPTGLTLDALKALPRQDVTFTLECSGDNGLPFFHSAVGNAEWSGTSLANILRAADIHDKAVEVVFYGKDQGEDVAHRGLPYELKYTDTFARSMSVYDAMNSANILCYEMNGSPLPAANGYPVRLIAPGWFGIANVKWLTHIEVIDHRYPGRFMGREYVTMREVQRDGHTAMAETPVGRMLIKSAPGRVVQTGDRYQIDGMAWGPNPISAVEVKIDNGPWQKAKLDGNKAPFTWQAWSLEWSPTPSEHTITSRAIDATGAIQPSVDDPMIANKKTYWESNGQITRRVQIA
jgi:DMSO/TMAO reductase YedYZ molybdopterin-dependent catalytic subunit